MINWLIGGVIFALTAFIIARTALHVSKGESVCCSSTTQGKCNCAK